MRAADAAVASADAAYLEAFEAGGVAPESFHHRDHVRLIWTYLRLQGLERGGDRMAGALRRFADTHAPGKYHETITRAWIRLVWAALVASPEVSFEAFLEAHTDLADKNRLRDFYRPETLASDTARKTWCEPDLEPLATSAVAMAGARSFGPTTTTDALQDDGDRRPVILSEAASS